MTGRFGSNAANLPQMYPSFGSYIARIWQHENDHLDGKMIIDRMGPVAKLASRRLLKELQEKWDARK